MLQRALHQRGGGRGEFTAVTLLLQREIQLQKLQGAGREGSELRPARRCLFWEAKGLLLGCRASYEQEGLKQTHCGELFLVGTQQAPKGIVQSSCSPSASGTPAHPSYVHSGYKGKKKEVLLAASFAKSMSCFFLFVFFLHTRIEKNRYIAFTNGILIWLLASSSCQQCSCTRSEFASSR